MTGSNGSSKRQNNMTLIFEQGAFGWHRDKKPENLRAMLWPIFESTTYTSADADIVKRLELCEGGTYAWAFVDNSRQRKHRWCYMSVCGNYARAKRFCRKGRTTDNSS